MRIALVMENIQGCISGGRYYTWLISHVLGDMGHDVTVFTDHIPAFYLEAFKYYTPPKVHQTGRLGHIDVGGFDVYMGAPFGGCMAAYRMAAKYRAWCVNIILDPRPLVERYIPDKAKAIYRSVPESKFKQSMRDCTIISNNAHAIPDIERWLGNSDILPVTATVNEKAAKAAGNHKRRDIVSTISRWERHKGFLDALHAVKRLPGSPEFHVITSFGDGRNMKQEGARRGIRVVIHPNASEEEKFRVLKKSRLFIFPSWYEGQGIPVLEAQLVKTPGVAYNFAVMREMAPNWPLAKRRDNKDLARKAVGAWGERKAAPVRRNLKRLKEELGAIF